MARQKPLKQMSNGAFDFYPVTISSGVLMTGGSTVEQELISIKNTLSNMKFNILDTGIFIKCTSELDSSFPPDGKYRKIVAGKISTGEYVMYLNQTPYRYDTSTKTYVEDI